LFVAARLPRHCPDGEVCARGRGRRWSYCSVEAGGADAARAEALAGAVRDGFEASRALVDGVERELLGDLLGGADAVGLEDEGADPGALQAERAVEAVGGVDEGGGVGGGLGELRTVVVRSA
jgi:hypothetical protein